MKRGLVFPIQPSAGAVNKQLLLIDNGANLFDSYISSEFMYASRMHYQTAPRLMVINTFIVEFIKAYPHVKTRIHIVL